MPPALRSFPKKEIIEAVHNGAARVLTERDGPYGATVLSYLGCNLPGLIMTNSLLLNMAIEIVNCPIKQY
jgi:hypothetical protein